MATVEQLVIFCHDGDQFSTRDADHDRVKNNCAVTYQGAWWFKGCHNEHLNGVYHATPTAVYGIGVQAVAYKGVHYSLKRCDDEHLIIVTCHDSVETC